VSTLDGRALLGHQAVADSKPVYAADVSDGPGVAPQLHHSITGGDGLLSVELGTQIVKD